MAALYPAALTIKVLFVFVIFGTVIVASLLAALYDATVAASPFQVTVVGVTSLVKVTVVAFVTEPR